MGRKKYDWSEENVRLAVSQSINYSDAARLIVGHDVSLNGHITTLKQKIALYDLNTEHFTGKPTEAQRLKGFRTRFSKTDLHGLCRDSTLTYSSVRKKVKRLGLVEQKCQKCGLVDEWLGEPLVLHMDHIDGDRRNNDLSNLRFLCPNCHSQTATYANKCRGFQS